VKGPRSWLKSVKKDLEHRNSLPNPRQSKSSLSILGEALGAAGRVSEVKPPRRASGFWKNVWQGDKSGWYSSKKKKKGGGSD